MADADRDRPAVDTPLVSGAGLGEQRGMDGLMESEVPAIAFGRQVVTGGFGGQGTIIGVRGGVLQAERGDRMRCGARCSSEPLVRRSR
ncbi:hypothetical protein [Streptomyces anulatus]|uniref:hypothetical protein n=1 Tax=Streptomyces anulatus TaxID=1892 RepID=UPI0033C64005